MRRGVVGLGWVLLVLGGAGVAWGRAEPQRGEVRGQLAPQRERGGALRSLAESSQVWREHGAALKRAVRSALATQVPRSAAAAAPAARGGSNVIPGEFIVRFEDAALPVSAQAVAQRLAVPGLAVTRVAGGPVGMHLVRVAPEGAQAQALRGADAEAFAERVVALLSARPGVRWVEANLRMEKTAVPNDSLVGLQWHYPLVNLPRAWDVTRGSSAVTIAVLDTGITSHPDLPRRGGRVLSGYDFISNTFNSADGDGRDPDPTDEGGDQEDGGSSWHGTHVAGTVGASTNNGGGVAAVDWRARIVPVRVLGRRGGDTFDIATAMEWAAGGSVEGVRRNTRPADVVNMSLGGEGAPRRAYQDVIDRHPRTTFVVAAGNKEGSTARFTPCNQRRVICVGAVGIDRRPASYTNRGRAVDVMAPGGDRGDLNGDGYVDGVLSTSRDHEDGTPVYEFMTGTSMATPHVSGIVALMHAARRASGGPRLTRSQIESILKATATDTRGCTSGCGAGLVNAASAVSRARGSSMSTQPELDVGVSELFLGDGGAHELAVANAGGGPLAVTAVAEGPEAARVAFRRGASLQVPAHGVAPLEVAVDTAGLAPGEHRLPVLLDAGRAGRATVALRVRVGSPAAPDALVAFAYRDAQGRWRVDPDGVVRASARDGYRYALTLPAGAHLALGAVDEDGDGVFFEEGEPVGFWRDLARPEPIEVRSGERVDGVSFELVPSSAP